MTIRDWVAEKLNANESYKISLQGQHGLHVERDDFPPAFIYCVDKLGNVPFTATHLDAAIREMPEAQAFILIKRIANGGAYELAESLGVSITRLGDLQSAVMSSDNIADYLSSEQKYVRSRITNNPYVGSIRRRGEFAYEISRIRGLRPIIVATWDSYEMTSDAVYSRLEMDEEVKLDAIINTNPSCRGLAPEVIDAGKQTGTRTLLFYEFLGTLREQWN